MQNSLYTIGTPAPLSPDQTQTWQLPSDCAQFLQHYGYGSFCDLLIFAEPDPAFMANNFADDMDLWTWQNISADAALAGTQFAQSIDGDIILAVKHAPTPILLLPRHDDEPVLFSTLNQLLDDYVQRYALSPLYFDSHHQAVWHSIEIPERIQGCARLKTMQALQTAFLAGYAPDAQLSREQQPQYALHAIGGWVRFDHVYGSAVVIKYQQPYAQQALAIGRMLENVIKAA